MNNDNYYLFFHLHLCILFLFINKTYCLVNYGGCISLEFDIESKMKTYSNIDFSSLFICNFVIIFLRCQMQDWDGAMLAEAEAKKDSMPRFHPIPAVPPISIREWSSSNLSHNVSRTPCLIVYSLMVFIISFNIICVKSLPCEISNAIILSNLVSTNLQLTMV